MKILLTGFEPFGGSDVNPSEQIARMLVEKGIIGIQISSAILPVDRQRGPAVLLAAVEREQPQAVVCLGEAAGRPAVCIERVALNLMDYRIPDNAGQVISDQPIAADGPAAYFSTLPVRAMLDAVHKAGVPAELSLSAGAFLCNQVFYSLMHYLAQTKSSIPAGFIHVPRLPEQAAHTSPPSPSMDLHTAAHGVSAALDALRLFLAPEE